MGAGTNLPGIPPAFLGPCLPPPCLSLAINYFRLAKSGVLLSCSQPPARQRPGPQPGDLQHPPSPECSGQLGWRKAGDLLDQHSHRDWGAERVGTGSLYRAEPQGPPPQRLCPGQREKWLRGQACICLGLQQRAEGIRCIISHKAHFPLPGLCHHPHFTGEKTEHPTKVLLYVCIMFPHLTLGTTGPGARSSVSPHSPTPQLSQMPINASVLSSPSLSKQSPPQSPDPAQYAIPLSSQDLPPRSHRHSPHIPTFLSPPSGPKLPVFTPWASSRP